MGVRETNSGEGNRHMVLQEHGERIALPCTTYILYIVVLYTELYLEYYFRLLYIIWKLCKK